MAFNKMILAYGTARKFAPAPVDGGEGTACPEVNAGGFKTPEGEIPIREEDRKTDDDFEKQLLEAEEQMKKLDEKLMRVNTMPVLTRVRDALAKEFHIKAGDVSARWKALHNEAASDDTEEPREAFEVDVMPSEKPQELKAVFVELVKVFQKFIVFKSPNDQATACALWTLTTWFNKELDFAPYILITAPEKRCGKSQLLGLFGRLVRRPLEAGSLTAPVLFRLADKNHPTFLIDEADSFLASDSDLVGMLKNGAERGKFAYRCEKDPKTQTIKAVRFDMFGPKALSGIGAQNIDGPLTDRCITIELRRKLTKEKKPKIRNEAPEMWEELRAKCARIAQDYSEKFRNYRNPDMPEALDDRSADKWRPLIALADLMDGEEGATGSAKKVGAYGRYCREAAIRLCADIEADEPRSIELLRNIREILEDDNASVGARLDYILSRLLVSKLRDNQDWQWQDCRGGKGLNAVMLAKMLTPFGIHSKKIRIEGNSSGYMKADFNDPFERYLTEEVTEAFKDGQG